MNRASHHDITLRCGNLRDVQNYDNRATLHWGGEERKAAQQIKSEHLVQGHVSVGPTFSSAPASGCGRFSTDETGVFSETICFRVQKCPNANWPQLPLVLEFAQHQVASLPVAENPRYLFCGIVFCEVSREPADEQMKAPGVTEVRNHHRPETQRETLYLRLW